MCQKPSVGFVSSTLGFNEAAIGEAWALTPKAPRDRFSLQGARAAHTAMPQGRQAAAPVWHALQAHISPSRPGKGIDLSRLGF